MINLLDDKTNQPSKFRTKNWVEINNEPLGTYNESNQIKFKTSMTRSNLCDLVMLTCIKVQLQIIEIKK